MKSVIKKKGKKMVTIKTIQAYVQLCAHADREVSIDEYLDITVFGLIPKWVEGI